MIDPRVKSQARNQNKTEMTFQSYAAGGTEFKKITN